MRSVLLVWFCLFAATAQAVAIKTPAGTVIVTRNRLLCDNTTLGYWNHLGIITQDGCVIESQEGTGVIKTPLLQFMARDYSEIMVLVPKDRSVGLQAAKRCEQLVGKSYRRLSSLFWYDTEWRIDRGLNCVSTVRIGYAPESKHWRTLHLPDGIFRFVDADFEKPIVVRTAR